MGGCGRVLPRRPPPQTEEPADLGSVWPCPEGSRASGGSRESVPNGTRLRSAQRRFARAVGSCSQDSGQEKGSPGRVFAGSGARSFARWRIFRIGRARLVGRSLFRVERNVATGSF